MPSTIIKPVSRDDVARLSDIAVELDELKNRLPDSVDRIGLPCIVSELHWLAESLDTQHGFGIYAAATDVPEAA